MDADVRPDVEDRYGALDHLEDRVQDEVGLTAVGEHAAIVVGIAMDVEKRGCPRDVRDLLFVPSLGDIWDGEENVRHMPKWRLTASRTARASASF
jgi:hypothetical protein